jgi:hypothetical protein
MPPVLDSQKEVATSFTPEAVARLSRLRTHKALLAERNAPYCNAARKFCGSPARRPNAIDTSSE